MTDQPVIYVVDDDDNCRESMCALVSARGYRVEGFRSGEDFLCSRPRAEKGCVITDYKMTGMSGLDLQEQLADQGCLLPVIMVSGHANVSVAVRAMVNGAVTLVEKPHTEEQLMSAIEEAVRKSSRLRERAERVQEVRQRWEQLSTESREVARLLVAGDANKVVARKMVMGLRTVERRRREMLKVMGVQTVPQLARLLVLVDEPDEADSIASP